MENKSFGQGTTKSFYHCSFSLYFEEIIWNILKEQAISQEVQMLTKRKMFAWQMLLQTAYLSKDNVNNDMAWKNLMQHYMNECSSTSSVYSLWEKKEVGKLTQQKVKRKALLKGKQGKLMC